MVSASPWPGSVAERRLSDPEDQGQAFAQSDDVTTDVPHAPRLVECKLVRASPDPEKPRRPFRQLQEMAAAVGVFAWLVPAILALHFPGPLTCADRLDGAWRPSRLNSQLLFASSIGPARQMSP